jgi:hypothetical protein
MTDMNETTPYLVVPEHDVQPKDQQKKRTSRLDKQIETSKKIAISSEHEEEDVGEKPNTAGGTTTTSGVDEPEVTSGVLKTETPSPAMQNEAEDLPSGGEMVEKLEGKSSDTNKEQEDK